MISYLGGAASFHEVSNSGLSEDFFGFDVLTRFYEGPPSKLATFRRLWTRNKQDPEFPWLFLVERPVSKLSPVVECNLVFKGTLEKNPKVQMSSDTRLQPLQLRNGSARGTAEYYGPVSTFRYIVVGDHPRSLSYAGQMLMTNFTYEIINQLGTGTIGIGSSSGGTIGDGLQTTWALVPRVVTSRFNCEQVGGCWQVTEENEGRLESPELRPFIGRR